MADSDATRSKRARSHAAGDHSLCRHPDVRSVPVPVAVDGGAGLDPVASLVALARRLEAAHEADPANSNVARELRSCLLALTGDQAAPPEDEVDRIRADWQGTGGM